MIETTKSFNCSTWQLLVIVASVMLSPFAAFGHNAFADSIVDTIPVSGYHVDVNSNTNTVYVAGTNAVSVIDGSANSVITTMSFGNSATLIDIVANPKTNMLYVEDQSSNSIFVIDGSTNSIVANVPDLNLPFSIAVNPSTNKIYVGGLSTPSVIVIDGSTNKVLKAMVDVCGSIVPYISVNPNTNKIYASCNESAYRGFPGAHYLSVIDGSTDTVVKKIDFGRTTIRGIAVNPNTNTVYLVSSSSIVSIDGDSDAIKNTTPVNGISGIIEVNSNTNKIYADAGSNSLLVIDGATINTIQTLQVGTDPAGIAVNQNDDRIYVVNSSDGTMSVIDGRISAASPPQNISANAVSSSQINLAWSAPVNNGGSPITGYQIERSTDSGQTWSIIVSDTKSILTTYSDTGLSSNTTYTYRVSAINSAGISAPSNAASATTLAVLTVNSQEVLGKPIKGIWMELHAANGDTVAEGYSPVSFDVVQGTQYTVFANNYLQYVFVHWDDGSMSAYRNITPAANAAFTATYTP